MFRGELAGLAKIQASLATILLGEMTLEMNFAASDTLVLLGIALSFFLVVLLLSSKSFRSDVHLYFAVTIISLNLLLTNAFFEAFMPANGITELIAWDFLLPFAFLIYVLKAIKHPLGNQRSVWLLLFPCIIFSAFQCIDFFFDIDVYWWLASQNEVRLGVLIEAKYFLFLLYAIALIGFAYTKIKVADLYQAEKRWLERNSLFLLLFMLALVISEPIAKILQLPLWHYLLIILAGFLVVITYRGVHYLNIAEQRRQIQELQLASENGSQRSMSVNEETQTARPKKGHPPSQKAIEKIKKLDTLMTKEQLYRQPHLSRPLIADRLAISEGYLSELLSSIRQTNFNDYVNSFRVQQTIEMFHDQRFDLYSIEAIGQEAGFKTKSVFYAAFKKVTQTTPGAYRKRINPS